VALNYAIISTYPPTQCGLATFSQALVNALASPADELGIISIVDEPSAVPTESVVHEWVRSQPGAVAAAAAAANRFDLAVIQHEFGIFGGRDGIDVLEFARALRVPAITVLHTVLDTPSRRQRMIIEELGQLSATLVTMTRTGQQRLMANYAVDPGKIRVIPHGAVDAGAADGSAAVPRADRRPTVLTWGLLGEGKGIEWGIEAMALMRDLLPHPVYQVIGQTHPRVLERFGEDYRERLVARADRLGVADSVHFDARYLAGPDLRALVSAADVVLLPYDSLDQVTSGVLIEAVVAGKPVISTAFPHAQELLSGGAGLLVPRQDPAAIAAAIRLVLTEPGRAAAMTAHALALAPDLLWPAVAELYRSAAAAATEPDITLASA
jgi:glycosyltransferase involved in cell wall biosynthesis